jgi:hypothetical protein
MHCITQRCSEIIASCAATQCLISCLYNTFALTQLPDLYVITRSKILGLKSG